MMMYEIKCECGETEIVSSYTDFFCFDALNKIILNFKCCACNQRRFKVKFNFNYPD